MLSDDTINSVTDARGANAAYGYSNNRHLVNSITYSVSSGVATTPNVTFAYDSAGNRTSASSNTGTSTYFYDQLSRLTSETYQFGDISGSYTLNYGYNLSGELTSLSIPFTSQSIGYNYDSTGRLRSMSASGFQASYTTPWPNSQTYTQAVTSFISNIQYRAWGSAKSVTYGNTVSESTSYNSRLEPTSYTLGNVSYTNTNVYPNQSFTSMGWSYDYYADGRVNHAYDSTWNFWDRSYSYDHAGRLAEADTNRVAHGLSWDYWHPDPYQQTSTYDVWNNLKRIGYTYSNAQNDFATYTNNRRSDSAYDANGNTTASPSYHNTIDVFGANTHSASGGLEKAKATNVLTPSAALLASTFSTHSCWQDSTN